MKKVQVPQPHKGMQSGPTTGLNARKQSVDPVIGNPYNPVQSSTSKNASTAKEVISTS